MDFNLTKELYIFFENFAKDQSIDPDGTAETTLQSLDARVILTRSVSSNGGGQSSDGRQTVNPVALHGSDVPYSYGTSNVAPGAAGEHDAAAHGLDAGVGDVSSHGDVPAVDGAASHGVGSPASQGHGNQENGVESSLRLTKVTKFEGSDVNTMARTLWLKLSESEEKQEVRSLKLRWADVAEPVRFDLVAWLPDRDGDLDQQQVFQSATHNEVELRFPANLRARPTVQSVLPNNVTLQKLQQILTDKDNKGQVRMHLIAEKDQSTFKCRSKEFFVSSGMWDDDPDPPTSQITEGPVLHVPRGQVGRAKVQGPLIFTESSDGKRLLHLASENDTADCALLLDFFNNQYQRRNNEKLDPHTPDELRRMLSTDTLARLALQVLHNLFGGENLRSDPIERTELLVLMRESEPMLNELKEWHDTLKSMRAKNASENGVTVRLHSILATFISHHRTKPSANSDMNALLEWEATEIVVDAGTGEVTKVFLNKFYFPPGEALPENFSRESPHRCSVKRAWKPKPPIDHDAVDVSSNSDGSTDDLDDVPKQRHGWINDDMVATEMDIRAAARVCPREIIDNFNMQEHLFQTSRADYPYVKNSSFAFDHNEWQLRTWCTRLTGKFNVTLRFPGAASGRVRARTLADIRKVLNVSDAQ
mmetsp:Transcript_23586/g.56842  ORF Transcript_23586/g.56842 Transcript_23586/m.56842 type:complete len:648 (+) Transcript_23586:189-2132(+)